MPWLLSGVKCPMCDGRHDLCLEVMPSLPPWLEFTCPATGVRSNLSWSERWAKEIPTPPPGSVPAREA
jgi:hypothetical protein